MIELLVLGGTLTIAAWAAGAEAHRRSEATRALDRYAQSRGYVFVPAPARGASPRVSGSKDGRAFVFDLYRLRGELRTRVSSTAVRGHGPIVAVSQRRAFELRQTAARLDDVAFDTAYAITIGDADGVEALRPAARSLLLVDGKRRSVWLRSDGRTIALSWQGTEADPLVFDAARDVVLHVAEHHRAPLPYR